MRGCRPGQRPGLGHRDLHRSRRCAHTVVARYAIAADGIRSVARRVLGIGEHGEASLGTAINVQFDADLGPYLGDRFIPIIWIINADTQGAFIRDGLTRWRYHFEIPPGADPAAVTLDECQKKVAMAIGDDVAVEVRNMWSWSHDLAVADTWRDGRIFLTGDAAHHFPPHGASGSTAECRTHTIWYGSWSRSCVGMLGTGCSRRIRTSGSRSRISMAAQMMHNTRQMEKTGFMMQDKNFLRCSRPRKERWHGKPSPTAFPEQQAQLASHGQQFGYLYQSDAVVPDGTEIVESSVAEYRRLPGRVRGHRIRGYSLTTR